MKLKFVSTIVLRYSPPDPYHFPKDVLNYFSTREGITVDPKNRYAWRFNNTNIWIVLDYDPWTITIEKTAPAGFDLKSFRAEVAPFGYT